MTQVYSINDWTMSLNISWLIFIVFLIAFILSAKFRQGKSNVLTLGVYCFSHGLSTVTNSIDFDGIKYFASNAYYLNWSLFESATVLSVYFLHAFLNVKHSKTVKIIYLISLVNMLSYIFMHYLAFEIKYQSHWFYPIYSTGINVTAILIALLLVLDFNFFRQRVLCKLKS